MVFLHSNGNPNVKKIPLQSWTTGSWEEDNSPGHLPHSQMTHLSYSLNLTNKTFLNIQSHWSRIRSQTGFCQPVTVWPQRQGRTPLALPSPSHSWCCRQLPSGGVAPLVFFAKCGQNWYPTLLTEGAPPQSCLHRMAEVLLEDRPELAGKSAQCMSAVAASCLEGQIGLAASSHSQHTACCRVLHFLHSHRTAEIARRCCNSSGRNRCLSYQSLTLPTIKRLGGGGGGGGSNGCSSSGP